MNAWKKILLALKVLLCLCGIVLVMFVQSRNSSWQRYSAQLEANGEPLTFKDVQARRSPQPVTNTIAEVVTRVADAVQKDQSRIPHGIYGLRDGPKINFFDGLDADTIELSRQYLASKLPILTELDTLNGLETGRFEVDFDCPAIEIFDSYIDKLPAVRPVARLLYLQSTLQLIDGDTDDASAIITRLLDAVSHLADEPSFIAHLIHIAAADWALHALEDILRVTSINDDSLRQIDAAFTNYITAHSMKWVLWGERAIFIELCDQMPTRTNVVDDVASIVFALERQQGTNLLSQLIDANDEPAALLAANKLLKLEIQKIPKTHVFTGMIFPPMPRYVELHLKNLAVIYAARIAIAAERYRLVEGRLPEGLEQLVPLYLSEIPIDPFDALPMKFSQNESGIIIYSVGENGVDDGGLVSRDKDHKRALDCGFRLFDFDKRGLIILEGKEKE